jgi:hypothetical protein
MRQVKAKIARRLAVAAAVPAAIPPVVIDAMPSKGVDCKLRLKNLENLTL